MAHAPKTPSDPILLARARAMRSEPAPAEQRLWSALRNRRLSGYKFRRQAPLASFIADFYCVECRLVVELDGDSHSERAEEDQIRTMLLERDGYRVIRFENADVFERLDAVLEMILEECERNSTPDAPSF